MPRANPYLPAELQPEPETEEPAQHETTAAPDVRPMLDLLEMLDTFAEMDHGAPCQRQHVEPDDADGLVAHYLTPAGKRATVRITATHLPDCADAIERLRHHLALATLLS